MKARFLFSLTFVVLLSACMAQQPTPPLLTPEGRPEIEIHAPMEQVRVSIITQQTGERAAILARATENRLTFVAQISRPDTEVLYDLKPSGAPYVRTTYVLRRDTHETRVSVTSEIVYDYGTATERSSPLDNPSVRQNQWKNLIRLRTIVEKRRRN